MSDRNDRDIQSDILNAASNLLGICFVLVAGIRAGGLHNGTYLDEFVIVAAGFFVGSCVLSYASIRARNARRRLGGIADTFFLIGLALLTVAVLGYGLGGFASIETVAQAARE